MPEKNLVLYASPGEKGGKKKVKIDLLSRMCSIFWECYKKHPEFTDRYRRIKARRGHKKAVIAAV